jgi:protein NirF
LAASFSLQAEKLFVVERSDSALSIIENHELKGRIDNLRNFNHAVVKFHGLEGYVITRDGFVIKFDPVNDRKIKEYQTSKSAIGFIIEPRYLAVANYDRKTVEILDHELNSLQTIETGSKNVGIKVYGSRLAFSLMDKDAIWVMEDRTPDQPKPTFEVLKKFENVGVAPFDAMLNEQYYIAGFFNSPYVGIVDLKTLDYRQLTLSLADRKPVTKVPHFGFWSISGDRVFIPAVGDDKVFVFDKDFNFISTITTAGLPVFTAISPDQRYLAVTFSGEHFPIVQIIDAAKLDVIKEFKFGGNVLHVRWSETEPLLYVSNNTENTVIALNTSDWSEAFRLPVRAPSGLFLFEKP